MKFDSRCEEIAFPFIQRIASLINEKLEVQYRIYDWDYKGWAMEKSEFEITELMIRYDEDDYRYPTYTFLKYKLDFAFPNKKINIEIDGEKYHDVYEDTIRDGFLIERGWKVIRIKAKDVFNGNIEKILEKEFGFGQKTLMELIEK